MTPNVEYMALCQVFGREKKYRHLSEAARVACHGDFPGINDMDRLLELHCLLTPRTMLKITYRFNVVLGLIESESAAGRRSELPSSYPYWTLFMIAMYYRLDPDTLDDFILEGYWLPSHYLSIPVVITSPCPGHALFTPMSASLRQLALTTS